MIYINITPQDSLIARDGRPFGVGQGYRMRSLQWPYPSVIAGSLRTLLGKNVGGNFNADTVAALKQLAIAGPLPLKQGQLYFPAPQDIVLDAEVLDANVPDIEQRRCFALRPQPLLPNEGCNFNEAGLWPVALMNAPEDDFKPQPAPPFWSQGQMVSWLTNTNGENFPPPPEAIEPAHEFL
ncbi:MAG: hypothetical protein GXP08_01410, partial [Gammaproteobacteria bacterium]|nr:hypothetical protein [Gammaproteobacteria bacterium]